MITRTITLGDTELPILIQILESDVDLHQAVRKMSHVTEAEQHVIDQKIAIAQSVVIQLREG